MDKKQIIERLKENKRKCRQYNFFGDDCHKQLDEMINILKYDLSPEQAEIQYSYDSLDVFDVLFLDQQNPKY